MRPHVYCRRKRESRRSFGKLKFIKSRVSLKKKEEVKKAKPR